MKARQIVGQRQRTKLFVQQGLPDRAAHRPQQGFAQILYVGRGVRLQCVGDVVQFFEQAVQFVVLSQQDGRKIIAQEVRQSLANESLERNQASSTPEPTACLIPRTAVSPAVEMIGPFA